MPRSVPFLRFVAMLAWTKAALPEFPLAEGPGKGASVVLPPLQVDDECAFELGLGEDHVGHPTVWRELMRLRGGGA
jgi:hypothetical protein